MLVYLPTWGSIFCFDKRIIQPTWMSMSSFALRDAPLSSHPLVLSKWRGLLTNSSCTRKRKPACSCYFKRLCQLWAPSVEGWVFIFFYPLSPPTCFPLLQCPIYCFLCTRRLKGGNTRLSRREYPGDALDKIKARVSRRKLLSTGLNSLTRWKRSPQVGAFSTKTITLEGQPFLPCEDAMACGGNRVRGQTARSERPTF